MTRKEAIEELSTFDHCILTPDTARKIAEPFGLAAQVPIRNYKHEPNIPKGVRLNDPIKNDGLGAHELAEWLCRQLKIQYRSCYGRGSQLEECCNVLSRSL